MNSVTYTKYLQMIHGDFNNIDRYNINCFIDEMMLGIRYLVYFLTSRAKEFKITDKGYSIKELKCKKWKGG